MTEQPENVSEQIGTDAIGDGGIDDNTGGEVYHGYSVDDEDQPQSTGDSLSDSGRVAEPLDEGYSPPERRLAGVRSGVRAGSARFGAAFAPGRRSGVGGVAGVKCLRGEADRLDGRRREKRFVTPRTALDVEMRRE